MLHHDGEGYTVATPGNGGVDLYLLRGLGKRECALLVTESTNAKGAMLWHRRMGHPGVNAMREMHKIYFGQGAVSFPKSQINDIFCESCIFAKASRLPFSRVTAKSSTRPGEILYTDMGTLPIVTFSGYRYFIVFVDEYTRFLFTFLMKTRDEVYHIYEDLRRKVRKQIS